MRLHDIFCPIVNCNWWVNIHHCNADMVRTPTHFWEFTCWKLAVKLNRVLLKFLPCPFDEEFGIIFVLGILPKDLEPGPGGRVAIEGWLWTCLILFCLVKRVSFWDKESSRLFSMLAGDQLTTESWYTP